MLHQPHPFLLIFMIISYAIHCRFVMPQTCAVQGCTNRSNKAGCENISFHHLPLRNAQVLKLWIIKTKLPHRLVNKSTRICSAHFVGGKRKDVPDLFPWTAATCKQPPPRKVPLPACEALLPPSLSPSPSPLPSESLQLSTSPSIPYINLLRILSQQIQHHLKTIQEDPNTIILYICCLK